MRIAKVGEEETSCLTKSQLAVVQASLHQGSAHASKALRDWIDKPTLVEIDSLLPMPMEEATGVLSAGEDPICFCAMEMRGALSGEMIFAFDDASGLALADILLGQPRGTATEWTEMATSAALETTNILCCAYLNALAENLVEGSEGLVPAPPRFNRDYAESLLQFALMGQAVAMDEVIVAKTRFEIDSVPVNWTLLFVPDAASMARLPGLLTGGESLE
ncbi:MAG: hypothetical protein ACR2NZ_25475 [Rubripirellula sp.]